MTETVRAPDAVQAIEAYVEQNGLLVLEAENGTATAGESHAWQTQTAQAGYAGSGYRRALPDIGARYAETETAGSPRLSWAIYNETAGVYSVWVRGMAPDAGGDSLHVGLDGQTPSTAADLTGFTNAWGWRRVTPGGSATLDLTETGAHTLDAWMREDGLRVDRLLLVTDTNYIPTGLGPAESSSQAITETAPGDLENQAVEYTYDGLHRLIQAAYSGAFNATFHYAYDAVDNRVAYTATITSTTVITYRYDAANRLLESVEQGGEATTYEWDAAGRLMTTTLSSAVTRLYQYDQRGNLRSATVDGLTTTFDYDGSGNRLRMTVEGGDVVTYTLDYARTGQVLFEEGGPYSNTKHYLYGHACVGEQVDAGDPSNAEWRYYQQDGNGMVRQATDGNGVVTLAWTYSPEGLVLEGEEGPVTHLGCEGNAIYDWSTGLIFKGGRYWDPTTGIWITLGGAVVWQWWCPVPLNRRQCRSKEKKRLLVFLLLLLVILALAGCDDPSTPCPPDESLPENPTPTPDSTYITGPYVRIKTVFATPPGGFAVVPDAGLGTIVDQSKRVILTHNHYGDDDPDRQIEKAVAITIVDSMGNETQVNNFQLVPIDDGTMLLDLDNNEITFNQQAVLGNPASVPEGADYRQVYSSGGSGFHFFPTTVLENDPNKSFFVIDNPGDLLRRGDSGGGGFVNNQLVGNLWSRSNVETAHAAKLPTNIQSMIGQAR